MSEGGITTVKLRVNRGVWARVERESERTGASPGLIIAAAMDAYESVEAALADAQANAANLARMLVEVSDANTATEAALAESRGEVERLKEALTRIVRWRDPQSAKIAKAALTGVKVGRKDDWRGRMANDEAETGTGRSQNLRTVIRDGEPQWQLRCPGCGVWADIDDDQLHGRVSVEHSPGSDDKGYAGPTGCGYHETRDWWTSEAPHEST